MRRTAKLRPYTDRDESAVVELWWRTWQATYPKINFKERVPWFRLWLQIVIQPYATIIVAEKKRGIVGFITIDVLTHYIDQIAVEKKERGRGTAQLLLNEAKRRSPHGIALKVNADNFRAIRFYEKEGLIKSPEIKDEKPKKFWMTWEPA